MAMFAGRAQALAPGYGAGPGYCAQFGSWPSRFSFEDIYACGGTESFGVTPFDADGNTPFQCVELSARFLWVIYAIWAGPGMGVKTGADLVRVVHAEHRSIAIGYPTPGSVPVAGDIVSLGPGGAVSEVAGHTGVVSSDDQRRGRFTIISENFPPGQAGVQTLQVDFGGHHNGRALLDGVWTAASWLELRRRPAPKPRRRHHRHRHRRTEGRPRFPGRPPSGPV